VSNENAARTDGAMILCESPLSTHGSDWTGTVKAFSASAGDADRVADAIAATR